MIRTLSLFSGAGGLDLGFHNEQFSIKACIELNKDACLTLEANKGKYLCENTKIYCEDITKLSPIDIQKEISDIDFIIGGPPCQSFSAAGRRAGGVSGINDTRGSLFWYYVQYLKVFRPQGFLFENVKGILQANKSEDWEIIKSSFGDLGYKLSYRVLDAADYGTPQHRERVILVGHREDLDFKFPRPVFGLNSLDKQPYVTPRMAFADIDDPNEIVPEYSGKYGHLLAEIPPGLNYAFYTERMGHPQPLFAWRSKFSGFLYKLNPDEPSKTLVANQGKYDGPFHWRNRKLNIEELIRIQGFPSDYSFVGSRISVEKQIGNSVAPKLARFLADAVAIQLFDHDEINISLLDPNEKLTRPKRTRLKPLTKKKHVDPRQVSLFEENINWPKQKTKLKLYEGFLKDTCTLSDGSWKILVNQVNQEVKPAQYIQLKVSFYQPIAKMFEEITCKINLQDVFDFQYAWDYIHKIVDYSCSYDSLLPLYGHFTEPYPKFRVDVSTYNEESSVYKLLQRMTDFNFLSKTHEYSELESIFGTSIPRIELIKILRSKGVDIRIHETNRTIPKGQFRICYPFTLPTWQPRFTKWIDIGKHETGDLDIKKIMTSSV